MKFYIITLFPELFKGIFDHSMMLKAKKQDSLEVEFINLRDFGIGPRRQVDDAPFGGGDGMLLKPEPLFAAVEHAKQMSPQAKTLLMTPRGKTYTQKTAQAFADSQNDLIIICGRYEGYDERITKLVDQQISIGNYVLTGGEIPAMILVDSITRLLPGVLGGEHSAEIESFSDDDSVEFPQYTRPAEFRDMSVPDVLLSGHHGEIEKWRKEHRS